MMMTTQEDDSLPPGGLHSLPPRFIALAAWLEWLRGGGSGRRDGGGARGRDLPARRAWWLVGVGLGRWDYFVGVVGADTGVWVLTSPPQWRHGLVVTLRAAPRASGSVRWGAVAHVWLPSFATIKLLPRCAAGPLGLLARHADARSEYSSFDCFIIFIIYYYYYCFEGRIFIGIVAVCCGGRDGNESRLCKQFVKMKFNGILSSQFRSVLIFSKKYNHLILI